MDRLGKRLIRLLQFLYWLEDILERAQFRGWVAARILLGELFIKVRWG